MDTIRICPRPGFESTAVFVCAMDIVQVLFELLHHCTHLLEVLLVEPGMITRMVLPLSEVVLCKSYRSLEGYQITFMSAYSLRRVVFGLVSTIANLSPVQL